MAGKLLTFSPPAKAAEPKVEVAVLLLQPFSEAPQISFERVPVGREAVRHLRVVNTSRCEQLVKLSGGLGPKGFTVDAQAFKVLPGQQHLVTFVWRPDGKEAASRVALTVASDKGFRGRCVLLGTVESQPRKPIRKVQRPALNILTTSQQANLIHLTPADTESCKKAAPPVKLTGLKEFSARSKKGIFAASTASSNHSAKMPKMPTAAKSCKEATTEVAAPMKSIPSNTTSRGTCPRKIPLESEGPLDSGDALLRASTREPTVRCLDPAEPILEARQELCDTAEPVNTVYEDSLEVEGHAGSTTSKSILNEDVSNHGQNDTFELDLSARMERLYQQILERKSSSNVPNSTATSELNLSTHLTSLYEEILERKSKQHPRGPLQVNSQQLLPEPGHFEKLNAHQVFLESGAAETSLEESPLPERFVSKRLSSSPRPVSREGGQLPDIQNILDELELCFDRTQDSADAGSLQEMIEKYGSSGLLDEHVLVDDFFPLDISSINDPSGNNTGK